METVFSHNISKDEMLSLFFVEKTKEEYVLGISEENRLWHLALLFEIRDDKKKAMQYWNEIPEMHQEYLLGFDDLILAE